MSWQEEIYKVPVLLEEKGVNYEYEYEYVLRGLHKHEVRQWSEFCASVFSYKTNPPQADYFYRHYANDPTTSPRGSSRYIRVATFEGRIVASCRIFRKEISKGDPRTNNPDSNPTTLRSGGIGEVCTDVHHRRRGLSKKLLETAIDIMEHENARIAGDFQISSLHAAPTFFPLYESLGYSAPPLSNPSGGNRWSTVDFHWKQRNSKEPESNNQQTTGRTTTNTDLFRMIRTAEFPRDTQVLKPLHARYSEDRLVGCIVRSQEYWNNYLSQELEGSLHVMESNAGQIVSWLSLKRDSSIGNVFSVREFGIDASFLENNQQQHEQEQEEESLSMDHIVGALVAHAIEAIVGVDGRSSSAIRSSLKLPGFVSDEIRSCETIRDTKDKSKNLPYFDWESECTEIDRGWMYRSVGKRKKGNRCVGNEKREKETAATNEFLGFVQGITTTPSEKPFTRREHFVWPSDSF